MCLRTHPCASESDVQFDGDSWGKLFSAPAMGNQSPWWEDKDDKVPALCVSKSPLPSPAMLWKALIGSPVPSPLPTSAALPMKPLKDVASESRPPALASPASTALQSSTLAFANSLTSNIIAIAPTVEEIASIMVDNRGIAGRAMISASDHTARVATEAAVGWPAPAQQSCSESAAMAMDRLETLQHGRSPIPLENDELVCQLRVMLAESQLANPPTLTANLPHASASTANLNSVVSNAPPSTPRPRRSPSVSRKSSQSGGKHGDRFKCGTCAQKFARKDSLLRHVAAVHTKSRIYVCPACDKDFRRRDHLRGHILQAKRATACRQHFGVPEPSAANDNNAGIDLKSKLGL